MTPSPPAPDTFVRDVTDRLRAEGWRGSRATQELPHYDYDDEGDLESLACHSTVRGFHLGTGASIYTRKILPAILSARHEVILVTCFWAQSDTLAALRDALLQLAARRRRSTTDLPRLRIHICFSSRSFFQRLFHTWSPDGYVYPPESWPATLGLPAHDVFQAAGIDLTVKSLFFFPVSVMHPKFVIVDRQRAFVPSCNVSWEPWLEGCIELSGANAITGLLEFYSRTWDRTADPTQGSAGTLPGDAGADSVSKNSGADDDDEGGNHGELSDESTVRAIESTVDTSILLQKARVATMIIPSSHHQNPHFHPLPWQSHPIPPPTPLNIASLELFSSARHSIYVQTPNLTSEAVIASLLRALQRRVSVTVVTGRSMMWLEQLVTAGTTTSRCVGGFVKRYMALPGAARAVEGESDAGCGRLAIYYYRPLLAAAKSRRASSDVEQGRRAEEPVQSHLKLMVVDDEFALLGSGNMDRASWFTSQELGILLHDAAVARPIKQAVDRALEGRLDVVFDSLHS